MHSRWLIAAVGLLASLTACPGTPPASVTTANVTVTAPAGNALKIGQAVTFSAAAKDRDGNALTRNFTWASSDPNVASVDAASGSVTAKRFGVVNITATADGVTGFSPIQTTYGLEAVGGTSNRPYITPVADGTLDPIGVAFFFRFRKADNTGPTATFNVTLTGPSGWNKDAPFTINNWGVGTPYYAWSSFTDPKAISGTYTLSTTIDDTSYTTTFTVNAADTMPAIATNTPSAITTSGATGTWSAVNGAAIYRAFIQDTGTGAAQPGSVFTTGLTATITGAGLTAAKPYRFVVDAYSFDPRSFLIGTSAPLPAKFNTSRNRTDFTF